MRPRDLAMAIVGLIALGATAADTAPARRWTSPAEWRTLGQASHLHQRLLITNVPAAFASPLVAEILSDHFVPVLASLDSTSQLRVVNVDGVTCWQATLADTSIHSGASALADAMRSQSIPIDEPLKLLLEQTDDTPPQEATFAMGCFWHGEGELGAIDGVVQTVPGNLGAREVVRVSFNPNVVSLQAVNERATAAGFESVAQTPAANGFHQTNVCKVASGTPMKADDGPKFYLQQTIYRRVPMTSSQACRVNAAIGHSGSPDLFLTSHQRQFAALVAAHPDRPWPNVVGVPLDVAWAAAAAVSR